MRKGTYTIILFTIGKDGLPLRRAAGFPQTLSVPQEGILQIIKMIVMTLCMLAGIMLV